MADLNEYEFFEGIDLREDVKTLMQIFGDSWEECRAEDCSQCKYRHGKEQYALLACISERYAENLIDAGVAPVRHGRWILVDTDEEQFFICSECENKEYWESDCCPKCGAKMDGGESDARNPIPRKEEGQRRMGEW